MLLGCIADDFTGATDLVREYAAKGTHPLRRSPRHAVAQFAF
jgi:uncharacterized protein YgbK (DUF1537 family)